GGGRLSSLVLDADGSPRIAFLHVLSSDLRYASGAIELSTPATAVVWPVGANRFVRWDGTGLADLSISTDGGASFQTIAPGISGGAYTLLVPRSPSTQCRIRVQRSLPYSASFSESLFQIRAGVDLVTFRADPVPFEAGALVTWRTNPDIIDLAGYRLEKSVGPGGFASVLALTRELSYRDPGAGPSTRYRLTAVNGLGDDLLLGEADFLPQKPLAVGPLPYRGGNLTISFASSGGPGGTSAPAVVALYDVRGRLVRTIV